MYDQAFPRPPSLRWISALDTRAIPPGITAQVPQPTRAILGSNDKHQLGQLAAEIQAFRKPEPYKGKGIFIGDQTIKLKDVKKK